VAGGKIIFCINCGQLNLDANRLPRRPPPPTARTVATRGENPHPRPSISIWVRPGRQLRGAGARMTRPSVACAWPGVVLRRWPNKTKACGGGGQDAAFFRRLRGIAGFRCRDDLAKRMQCGCFIESFHQEKTIDDQARRGLLLRSRGPIRANSPRKCYAAPPRTAPPVEPSRMGHRRA